MSGIFDPVIFDSGMFDAGAEAVGIGLASVVGIGLARPPTVDFVFSGRSGMLARSNVIDIRRRVEAPVKPERTELQEMMELYSRWRRAA